MHLESGMVGQVIHMHLDANNFAHVNQDNQDIKQDMTAEAPDLDDGKDGMQNQELETALTETQH